MASDARIKRERFLPFAFARHGLALRLEEAWLDGEALPIESETTLHVDDEGWRELRLQGVVELRKDALMGLPDEDREAATLWLAVRCDRTAWRAGVGLGPAQNEVTFEVVLERSQIEGAVAIVPWLVRSRASEVPAGYAGAVGARLATGGRLMVYPHEPAPRAGQFLDVVYVRFSEDPVLRGQPWRLYQLETHGETPVLRINADHEDVARILDARGQTGLEARLREVFYDQISRGVWSLLFMSAVEALDDEGRAGRSWQGGVLAELLPHLFPSTPKRARMDELLALRDDEAKLSLLATKCDEALQRRLELVKHMSRLIEVTGGRR